LNLTPHERLLGCLLGTAVGDALGLPFENLTSQRRAKLFGELSGYRLVLGKGMGSDDTEHTVHVARALIRSRGDVEGFRRALSRSLRAWFLCLPAGAGKATIFGCVRMIFGVSPTRSGIHSAGNGPAMRSAIIGVMYRDDPERMRQLIEASTVMTHSDPLALSGALLVAVAAGSFSDPNTLMSELLEFVAHDDIWRTPLARLRESLAQSESTLDFARSTCPASGVSGYIVHTVPVALHAALSATSVSEAVKSAVECGGDTDTTGAIAGAICGARLGPASIPAEWLERWVDTPISMTYLRELADRLSKVSEGEPAPPASFAWWKVPPRNVIFFMILLVHIGRRILPPYR
jgi:ADP-ribosyl-[dinitrogen reductase] hydrolase